MGERRRFRAVYFRDADGLDPVDTFLDGLPDIEQFSIDAQIDRLNLLGPDTPHLPHPHSSQVHGEIRELRCHHGKHLYRILYARSRGLIVLLHAFRKTTAKVPRKEIEIAEVRWHDFKVRMNVSPRQRPRAIGRDAP